MTKKSAQKVKSGGNLPMNDQREEIAATTTDEKIPVKKVVAV
ncbi:hypothetical protein [Xenorhabdus lircayensis]|nr:hypothetical protein [Xenorhabdus lircayensis]